MMIMRGGASPTKGSVDGVMVTLTNDLAILAAALVIA